MLRAFLLIIVLIVLVVASVFLALLIKQAGPGYVLIYYNHYSIETSVWFLAGLIIAAIIALTLLYMIAAWLIGLIASTSFIPHRLHKKRQKQKYAAGLLAYQSHDWEAASRQLYASANSNDRPFINYILSANAALERQDFEQAKKALQKAAACDDIDSISLTLTEVDLAFAKRDDDSALRGIQTALNQYPKEPRVVLKAYDLYQKTGDKRLLNKALPALTKQALLPAEQLHKLNQAHLIHQLEQASDDHDTKAIEKIWKQARPYHDEPACYLAYFKALQKQGEIPAVMKKCEKQLKSHWHEPLMQFYISINHNKQQQYDFLQDFLATQGDNPALHLSLAKLALVLGKDQEAEEHLHKNLAMQPNKEANFLLAKLYADRQQRDESMTYLSRVF